MAANLKLVTDAVATLTHHPVADVFPMMPPAQAATFAADIKQHGQREPIILIGSQIIDGRERNRACLIQGIEPRCEQWDGIGSPLDYVISKNLHRKHYSTSQRAMIAARATNLKWGQRADEMEKKAEAGKPDSETFQSVTVIQAAERFNVSRDSVSLARQIIEKCQPQEIQAVDDGTLTVKKAHRSIAVRNTMIAGKPDVKRTLSLTGKNPERIAKARIKQEVWRNLRIALEALNELPLPADVVPIARAVNRNGFLEKTLPVALKWLTEFEKCL